MEKRLWCRPSSNYIYVITEDSIKIMKKGSFMCRTFLKTDFIKRRFRILKIMELILNLMVRCILNRKMRDDKDVDHFEKSIIHILFIAHTLENYPNNMSSIFITTKNRTSMIL